MTSDEILFMSPAELREAIAKVKGYECKSKEKINSNGFWVYVSDKLAFEIPNWPENIADAWKLVDDMPNITIEKIIDSDRPIWQCCCDFWCAHPNIEAHAPTAPLAISRAWLMWKEKAS